MLKEAVVCDGDFMTPGMRRTLIGRATQIRQGIIGPITKCYRLLLLTYALHRRACAGFNHKVEEVAVRALSNVDTPKGLVALPVRNRAVRSLSWYVVSLFHCYPQALSAVSGSL